MYGGAVYELSDCSEFRQTVEARPPAVVHGTALMLILLLAAAVTWAALVEANLVVRAPGRVRPVDQPAQVFTSAAAQIEGRVAEVHFTEGSRVVKDQLLLRLDTERIENEIAQLRSKIAAAEEELAELNGLDALLREQFASAQSKAEAELDEAKQSLAKAEQEQASRIREADAELTAAADRLARYSRLRRQQAVSQDRFVEAETQHHQAQEKLAQARLPLDAGRVEVLRRALKVINDDFAVRQAELELKQVAKQGEAEAAGKQLANLLLARRQSVLRAPIDGVVVSPQVDVGDVLEPGKPCVEIASEDGFRFEAAVPSGDVGDLEVGMPVQIKFDAYDYQKYGTLDGTVCFISPDSQVTQSDNSDDKGDANPIAYLVRVELHGDEVARGEMQGKVKLGLGGTAEIVTGQESILAIFVKKIRRTISLG